MGYRSYRDYPMEHLVADIVIEEKNGSAKAYDRHGNLIVESSNHDDVLDNALGSLPNNGVLEILGKLNISRMHIVPVSATIIGYGARLVASAQTTAARMLEPEAGTTLIVKGLTFDLAGIFGVATGTETTRENTMIVLEDVRILNVYNYGVSQNGDGGKLILRNVEIRAVDGQDSSNELIETEDQDLVVLDNVRLYGNKPLYIAADTVILHKVVADTSSYPSHVWMPINARKVIIDKCVFIDTGPAIRPHGDIHLDVLYNENELTVIRDTRLIEVNATARIYLEGATESYGFRNVVIDGVTADKTPIYIRVHSSYSGSNKSYVKNLSIRNVSFKAWSAGARIAEIADVDIENGVIDNVRLPDDSLATSALLYLSPLNFDIDVNLAVKRIKGNIANALSVYDGGRGGTITGTIELEPLLTKIYNISGTVNVNTTFKQSNEGTATITGDGTTTEFVVKVQHGLISDKVAVAVSTTKATTAPPSYIYGYVEDDDGDGFKETLVITVRFDTAPASGETVEIYWRAWVVG